jgi:hypothetical protein
MTFQDERKVQPNTVYCRLEDILLDPEGNLAIFISKDNKTYLTFIARFLRQFIGSECIINFRFFKQEGNKFGRSGKLQESDR